MKTNDIMLVGQKISNAALRSFLGRPFEEMIKYAVDVEREIAALGGEMHADAEQVLLENGSRQVDIWGGNIYPDAGESGKIEHIALINIRPSSGNRSMEILDDALKARIKAILDKLIEWRGGET